MKEVFGRLILIISVLIVGGCERNSVESKVASSQENSNRLQSSVIASPSGIVPVEKPVRNQSYERTYDNLFQKKPSAWYTALHEESRKALAASNVDVLLVPFQSKNEEFSASTRTLFSLSTADLLQRNWGLKVSDITTASEALGINQSEYDWKLIQAIAQEMSVKTIVLGSIQHDAGRLMHISLKRYGIDDATSSAFVEQEETQHTGIAFDEKKLPIYQYRSMQSEMLQALFGEPKHSTEELELKQDPLVLSADLDNFFTYDKTNPLESARRARLLGLLSPPPVTERYGRINYAKSLINLMQIKAPTDSVLLMQAEAMLALNRRPAAQDILKRIDNSPEKYALQQYAMGNVLEKQVLDTIADPVARIVAHVRNQRIRNTYGLKPDYTVLKDAELPNVWLSLFYGAFEDGHTWRDTDSDKLKQLLDELSPEKAFSLTSINMRKALTPWRAEGNTIEQATLEHIETIRNKLPVRSEYPSMRDLIDVVQSQLIENVVVKIEKEAYTRGNYEYAVELVDRYEPLFEGQADFLLVAAEAYSELANVDGLPEKRREGLHQKLIEAGKQGFLYADKSMQRSISHNPGLNELYNLPAREQAVARGVYRWPATCHLLNHKSKDEHLACVDNAISNFWIHRVYADTLDTESRQKYLDDNFQRFIGHESRLDFLYSNYSLLNDTAGVKKVEQELIRSGVSDWALLKRMADTARLESRYNKAADIILSHPELKDNNNISNVHASNRSFDIGSRMYWAGAHEAATRLFEMTTSRNTGSSAEMSAAARLATMSRDYETAAYYQYERIERYRQSYAMRDLIGLISLMGDAEQAMIFADSLAPFFNQPHVWHGSLIAHRANNMTLEEQLQWANDHVPPEVKKDTSQVNRDWYYRTINKNRFLFMASVTDREITDDTLEMLGQYFRLRTQSVIVPKDDSTWSVEEKKHIRYSPHNEELIVSSRYLIAARALKLLGESKYQEAEVLLDNERMCHSHNVEFLWICAWAAGGSNTHPELQQRLTQYIEVETDKLTRQNSDPQGKLFDQKLALAIILGFDQQHDEAIRWLKNSNADHRYTEDRSLFVRYQTLEAIRVLYQHSNDDRYKDLGIQLATSYTVVDPIASYNHTFIAIHSDNRGQRVEALASLLLMDPQSRALTNSVESELKDARIIAKARKQQQLVREDGI